MERAPKNEQAPANVETEEDEAGTRQMAVVQIRFPGRVAVRAARAGMDNVSRFTQVVRNNVVELLGTMRDMEGGVVAVRTVGPGDSVLMQLGLLEGAVITSEQNEGSTVGGELAYALKTAGADIVGMGTFVMQGDETVAQAIDRMAVENHLQLSQFAL